MTNAAPVLGPIGELKAHALLYAEQGMEVFPLHANKAPLTANGFYDATTDPATIEAWWGRHPNALIGHRIAVDLVLLDIDPRHRGDTTWAAVRQEHGEPFPLTRAHASGRGDGGGHLWWVRPDDNLTTLKLDAWARERGLGHAIEGTSRWTSGIDILHHDLRYTILPPSPHPDTGKAYHWLRGLDLEPLAMPAMLADLLIAEAVPLPAQRTTEVQHDPDSIADWYSAHTRWDSLLVPLGWRVVAGDGHSDGSRYRHPSASSACSATIRHGCLFVYTPNTPFEVTAPGDIHGYTPFRAYATLHHGGDASKAASAAREMKGGPRPERINVEDLLGEFKLETRNLNSEPENSSFEEEPAPSNHIPDVVWDSREALGHIRTAARARMVSPDAVLGAVLCRVAACTDHTVVLPATVGNQMGLTYYAAIVGSSEAGKSAAVAVAAQLVPAPEGVIDGLPVGTGEGMIDVLFHMFDGQDELTGRHVREKRQNKHAAIFAIDEGQTLADLGSRRGSTIMQTLRSAWTSSTLGQANAGVETKRIAPAHSYVYGITLNIQPELAGPFLSEAAGGTPQRFLWMSANDPDAPQETPVWPGELPWRPPGITALEALRGHGMGLRLAEMKVHPQIVNEIRDHRRSGLTGQKTVDNLDAHRMLLRTKTAALLAILDGRVDIDLEDWHLADLIVEASRLTRQKVVNTLRAEKDANEIAAGKRQAIREGVVEFSQEARATTRAVQSIGRTARDHRAESEHAGEGCVRRCFTQRLAGRDKKLIDIDDCIQRAVEDGLIERVGKAWSPVTA